MSDLARVKDEIRKQMREKRRTVKAEERKASGKAICQSVMGDQIRLLLRAWRTCIYLSAKNEIPTRYIARAIWEAGRDVCVPAWSRTDEAYKLYAITPRTKLVVGHCGIREPMERLPVFPWDVDAFILPGLAFDAQGGRLGFGAGYYDKILAQATKRATKIALCYDWQIRDDFLPQEPHDIPMDWLVSETRVIPCAENRKRLQA
jgi:5-formyltetrahydrofolate cyclo-ligase